MNCSNIQTVRAASKLKITAQNIKEVINNTANTEEITDDKFEED